MEKKYGVSQKTQR